MIEKVKNLIGIYIKEKYPFLNEMPYMVKAEVTKVAVDNINIRIMDEYGNPNSDIPEIPDVKTTLSLVQGDIVRVGFYYGNVSMPYIDGRA